MTLVVNFGSIYFSLVESNLLWLLTVGSRLKLSVDPDFSNPGWNLRGSFPTFRIWDQPIISDFQAEERSTLSRSAFSRAHTHFPSLFSVLKSSSAALQAQR